MTAEFQYRAFISYSHADEEWAKWLHKSLETYRMPKRLVGRETEFGPVPEKIAGDPSSEMSDVRKVDMVFRKGVGFDPQKLIASVSGKVGLW